MSPRPKERTSRMDPADVAQWKAAFGAATHAFRCVIGWLPSTMSWPTFRAAVSGHRVRPVDLQAVQAAYRQWKATPK